MTDRLRDVTTSTPPSGAAGSADHDSEAVHVVYIAGIGRSGSTLVCRTLGTVPGFQATGELMRILGRGVTTGDLCSCGSPVRHCEFWSRVWQDLAPRCPDLDFERLERTRRRITEEWELLRYLFLRRRHSQFERDLHDLRRFVAALYKSIRRVTGARTIVDASKSFMFGKLLTETPGVSVDVLHLVRDSRGVAYSLARRAERPGTHGRREHFGQHGAFVGSVFWSAANVATECLGTWTPRIVRVRYEDFVANPSSTMTRVVQALGTAPGNPRLPHVNGRSVHLGTDHLIASNSNRSRRGEIELQEDLAWTREMAPSQRWLVTGLTFPLLRRYGYPAVPGRPAGRDARRIVAEQPEP